MSRTEAEKHLRKVAKRATVRPSHEDKYADRAWQDKLERLAEHFNTKEHRR